MAASQQVLQAVQAAIVASAHLAAFEQVSAAAQACERLGALGSGRWRAGARSLRELEDDLERSFAGVAETLTSHATDLGIPEEALWVVGDAAGTLEMLRDAALAEVDEETRAARALDSAVLFGVSFLEDPDLPDRGTTLLYSWADPFGPALWPWQANWVVGDAQDDNDGDDDQPPADALDLYEVGDLDHDEALVAALAAELDCGDVEAREALRDAALALTRASLIAGGDGDDEADEEDDEGPSTNGAS
jgi:hypothetical protein